MGKKKVISGYHCFHPSPLSLHLCPHLSGCVQISFITKVVNNILIDYVFIYAVKAVSTNILLLNLA